MLGEPLPEERRLESPPQTPPEWPEVCGKLSHKPRKKSNPEREKHFCALLGLTVNPKLVNPERENRPYAVGTQPRPVQLYTVT